MLSGTFATMPFADLLQWISDARRSGTLQIGLEFEDRYLRFVDGSIGAYGSDDPMARDLGRLCLMRGLCNEEAILDAVEQQRRSHMPLGDVLVSSGAVTHEALEAAVRKQIEETVLGLFLWPEGRFTYRDELAPEDVLQFMPPEYELADPIPTRAILMEGMRRLDEWTRIVKVLPTDEVELHALGPDPELPLLEEIAAHPHPPTLGQLLALKGDSRFSVCEELFRAFERGLIAVEAPNADATARAQRTARGSTTVAHLVRAAHTLIAEGQHDEAAALLRSALALDPFRAEARALLKRSREEQLDALYAQLRREAVPRLLRAGPRTSLSAKERRVLSQINGRWDVGALALTSGVGELDTLRALKRLVHAGLVAIGADG
jgi:tetratricopeptide (TPR) repeat protein